MRVGFTGAGGTGKTTHLHMLKDCGLPILPSVARDVFKKFGVMKETDQDDMTPMQRKAIQIAIFNKRFEMEESMPDFISDRTLLDHYFYVLHRCYPVLTELEVVSMETRVSQSLRGYDRIVYFPVSPNIRHPESDFGTNLYGERVLADKFIYGYLRDLRGIAVKMMSRYSTNRESRDHELRSMIHAIQAGPNTSPHWD